MLVSLIEVKRGHAQGAVCTANAAQHPIDMLHM